MAGQLLVAQLHWCAARLIGGTAIPAEIVLAAGEAADGEEDAAPVGPARAAALFVVMGVAVGLCCLPLIGLGLGPTSFWGQVAEGLGGLVAVVGGAKFAAMAAGLAAACVD
jgi:hypothetical protein